MQALKISIIGCGYWGKHLVRNFFELGVLCSVCDLNQELATQTADTYGVPALTMDEIFQGDCDAVVIAAPAAQHFDLTQRALKAKKNVFVEKPLSLKIDEAKILYDLGLQVNKKIMVGHLLQYHPAYVKLKQLVQDGRLGRIFYIYSNRLNLGKFRHEENILWSFAPHDISMILGLTGDLPEKVYSTGACYLNPNIHDVTTTHMSFKNSIQAHIFVSWLHPFKEQKLVVVGDRGMATFDDSLTWEQKLKIYPHQVTWIDGLPLADKADHIDIPLEISEPLKVECQHFIDCIIQNIHPISDALEGVRVLQVLDAAQRSLCSGNAINISNDYRDYYLHETAIVDDDCEIGKDTKIWHFSHVIHGSKIGEHCVVGQNVMIGPDVTIGHHCKIQNNVSLYKGVVLEDGVFCGPSCVFTNVLNPRAEINRKNEFKTTIVEKGVSIGANATIVCGNRLGAYCLIGAGAVITKDVKPHAMVVGNPARQIGWVSHAGEKLGIDLVCPREARRYFVKSGYLVEIAEVDSLAEKRGYHKES